LWEDWESTEEDLPLTAEELQEDNVKTTRLAESESEDKSEEEKENSEELHWRLVDANQTDVSEDVWEEHVEFVQELNVLERKKSKDVSESEPEDTEESIAQEESEELEESEETEESDSSEKDFPKED